MEGQNFKNKDQVITVGGKGQSSVEGVKSFTLKLSEYLGKEIKGFSYSSDASGKVTDMVLGKYEKNSLTQSFGTPKELYNKYGSNFSVNNIMQQFHTHPNGELGATQSAPELSQDVRNLQDNKPLIPNATFIILYRVLERQSQLNMIIPTNINPKIINMKNLAIILTACIMSTINIYSQSKVIHGRVISDSLETIPGVLITVNDSIEIGKTDFDGFFKIDIPVSENKILFKSIGLEPTTIELGDNCGEVELVMMLSGTYDFATPKNVDRIRKRNLKNCQNYTKKLLRNLYLKQTRLAINKILYVTIPNE